MIIVLFDCIMLHKIYDELENRKEVTEEVPFYKKELPENIRVLLHTTDFKGVFHSRVEIKLEGKYCITKDTSSKEVKDCRITERMLKMKNGDMVSFIPMADDCRLSLESVRRNVKSGYPSYRGLIELKKMKDGYLIINELPLETYLCGVISSEMPSSYPIEALKAQAVCARTYAYQAILDNRISEYGANVDDSTSFQVYQNVEETANTTRAVNDTKGEIMIEKGMLADACYYSTSCGLGEDGVINRACSTYDLTSDFSNEKVFRKFIDTENDVDYEREEPWYRWNCDISLRDDDRTAKIGNRILERYEETPDSFINVSDMHRLKGGESIGKIHKIAVHERQKNGMINKLFVQGEHYSLMLCGEYNIRYVLGDEKMEIEKQDGSVNQNINLLPSAYFYIVSTRCGDYTIRGGGYGHSRGMSQNAAKYMAEEKKSYKEIIKFFYKKASITKLEEYRTEQKKTEQ